MNRYVPLAILFILLGYYASPLFVSAHTSDERYIDGYVLDLSTAPVAPWVGEKTGMSFVFLDPKTFRATSTVVSATLVVDALMRANGKKPEVIYTSETFPVTDGGFMTSYVFPEEGTYDIHVEFKDVVGVVRETGFRKQVRSGGMTENSGIDGQTFFLVSFFVAVCAFIAGRFSIQKK